MNTKTTITIDAVIKLIIWTAVSILMILLSFYATGIIAKKGGDWLNTTITAVGNFSGGIIGGIVAYIVASFQIKKSADLQKKDQQREIHTILRLLNEEISYNKEVIQVALPYNSQVSDYLSKHLQIDQWKNLSSKVGTEINDNDFIDLCDFYRKLNFMISSSNVTDETLVKSSEELATKLITKLQNNIDIIKNNLAGQ